MSKLYDQLKNAARERRTSTDRPSGEHERPVVALAQVHADDEQSLLQAALLRKAAEEEALVRAKVREQAEAGAEALAAARIEAEEAAARAHAARIRAEHAAEARALRAIAAEQVAEARARKAALAEQEAVEALRRRSERERELTEAGLRRSEAQREAAEHTRRHVEERRRHADAVHVRRESVRGTAASRLRTHSPAIAGALFVGVALLGAVLLPPRAPVSAEASATLRLRLDYELRIPTAPPAGRRSVDGDVSRSRQVHEATPRARRVEGPAS